MEALKQKLINLIAENISTEGLGLPKDEAKKRYNKWRMYQNIYENLYKYPKTINTVNNAIQVMFPEVILVKGKDYFYIYGALNTSMDDFVASLPQSGIYVSSIRSYTIAQWVEQVELLLNQKD